MCAVAYTLLSLPQQDRKSSFRALLILSAGRSSSADGEGSHSCARFNKRCECEYLRRAVSRSWRLPAPSLTGALPSSKPCKSLPRRFLRAGLPANGVRFGLSCGPCSAAEVFASTTPAEVWPKACPRAPSVPIGSGSRTALDEGSLDLCVARKTSATLGIGTQPCWTTALLGAVGSATSAVPASRLGGSVVPAEDCARLSAAAKRFPPALTVWSYKWALRCASR